MAIPVRRRVQHLAGAVVALVVLAAVRAHWQLGALGAGLVLIGIGVALQRRRRRVA